MVSLPCGAQTENVAKPDVKVGDSWTYNRTTNSPVGGGFRQSRVVQVNDKAIQVVVTDATGKESDETYTSEWNPVGGAFGVFYPYVGLFQFPIRIGSSYQFQFELVPALATNVRTPYAHTAKVVGWEEVQVPAGKFRAVKIETRGTWRNLERHTEGTARFVVWYVPQVRRLAKLTYEETVRTGSELKPVLRIADELIAFKLE